MKLLANENFPQASVIYLKNSGFDIISVGLDFQGITDKEVIELAIKEERTIITFDRDYGELIFKLHLNPSKGIIYLRLNEFKPEEPGKIVKSLMKDYNLIFENFLTVFDGESIRQKKFIR